MFNKFDNKNTQIHADELKRLTLLWIKKLLVLIAGVFIMSFGGVFCVKSQLGLAPATVVPYVLSRIGTRSFGCYTTVVNVLLVAVQVAILRGEFKRWQYLQLIVALLFGVAVDFATWCLRDFVVTSYIAKCLCSIFGMLLIALGISMEILSESIPAPADSAVRTISVAMKKDFGSVKTVYDVVFVIAAVVLSYGFTGKVIAVREGTLVLALFTGTLVKALTKKLVFINKIIT